MPSVSLQYAPLWISKSQRLPLTGFPVWIGNSHQLRSALLPTHAQTQAGNDLSPHWMRRSTGHRLLPHKDFGSLQPADKQTLRNRQTHPEIHRPWCTQTVSDISAGRSDDLQTTSSTSGSDRRTWWSSALPPKTSRKLLQKLSDQCLRAADHFQSVLRQDDIARTSLQNEQSDRLCHSVCRSLNHELVASLTVPAWQSASSPCRLLPLARSQGFPHFEEGYHSQAHLRYWQLAIALRLKDTRRYAPLTPLLPYW